MGSPLQKSKINQLLVQPGAALFCFCLVPAAVAAPCPQAPGEAVTITEVTERLELQLADGRRIRLAGLERPASGEARATGLKDELSQWLRGREVLVRALAQKPDRWGRLPAQVFGPLPASAEAGALLPYVNEALAAAGSLRVEPGAETNDCLALLYEVEAQARAVKFGVWADPAFAPVEAGDTEALVARSGQFTLVEGRARRVGQGRSRFYLDFGKGRGDFSLTVQKRLARRFAQVGRPLESLAGQLLRARGVIETRFGPQIDISGPEEIEFIPGSVDKPLTKPVDKETGR